jgi:predicted porin
MKKSLIALAVAGVVSAPAFAATANVDVYGAVRMSVDMNSSDVANSDNTTITDRASRFGLKGSEDLGGGLKAIWQIEQGLNATNGPLDNTTNRAVTVTTTASGTAVINRDTAFGGAGLRNTFVGLSGGFGTVIIGRTDTPYKLAGSADLFGDTAADAQGNFGNNIIGRNGFDKRISGTIAYVSPDFSGFSFAAAIVPGEQTGVNAADGISDATSLMGAYKNGPMALTVAYEQHDGAVTGSTRDLDAWKINGSYTMGDLKFGATYEKSDDVLRDTGAVGERADVAWLVSAAYAMGPMTFKAQYGDYNQKEAAGTRDLDVWTVGLDYNLSKRTNAYVLYTDRDNQAVNTDTSVFSIGMNHSF